jgi:hypothetical protein
MKYAFGMIVGYHKAKLADDPNAELNFDVIYRAKIPYQVEELLRGTEEATGLCLMKDIEGSYNKVEVETQTGGLILSYVANRLAQREGVAAITDYDAGFAVNAIENQRIRFVQPPGFASGCLIGAIASCQIPAEIKYLSVDDYKELRNQYSAIRAVFKKLADGLAQTSNLNTIDSPAVLEESLQTTIKDFIKECDDYAATRAAKKIRKWAPWGIGSLVGITSALIGPVAGLAGKIAQVGFQAVDKTVNQSTKDISEQRPHQMLCQLKEDVLERSLVKSMLHL